MKKPVLIMGMIILLFSCEQIEDDNQYIEYPESESKPEPEKPKPLIECPDFIAESALSYAFLYSEADTEYVWGGQDYLRAIGVDCSGLVVNCYLYATNDTPYALPFYDAAVINFFTQWSTATLNPRPGDLIFVGSNKNRPTHMCLYVGEDEDNIYFIDSNTIPNENVNGVSERFYPKNYGGIISYGRLLVLNR